MSRRDRPSVEQVLVAAAAAVGITAAVTLLAIVIGVTLVGRSGAGLAQPLDDAVRPWIESNTSTTNPIANALDALCGAGAMTAAAAAAGLVMWWRTRRPFLAATPLIVALAADTVVLIVKEVVARPRPVLSRGTLGDQYSFPSGHVTVTAAVVVAIALTWVHPAYRRVALLAAVGFAGLVALSRLVLGVHWFTDVVVGAGIGTLLAVSLIGAGRGVPWIASRWATPAPSASRHLEETS